MNRRIKVIRKKSEVTGGRKNLTPMLFYECWCEVQSLGSSERYAALQNGVENTIVFKVRNCMKVKEIRKNLKECYIEYDDMEYKVYDASPMVKDNAWVLLKCRTLE